MIPGLEGACGFQFNHFCRLWFYLRCIVLAHFPNVVVIGDPTNNIPKLGKMLKSGDVILVVSRGSNHTITPPLFALVDSAISKKVIDKSSTRVGVFHTGNERNRTNWPWYNQPDFVIRNYLTPVKPPPHVQYVPLGGQYPHECHPSFIESSSLYMSSKTWFSRKHCSCGQRSFKPSSQRRYLWSFSGSLRKRRGLLLRTIGRSGKIKDKGIIRVVSRFGGDGRLGTRNVTEDPKTDHLKLIEESVFVFAPCGNAMETFRIYESIILGAIPIVENCEKPVSQFFPFTELMFEQPKGMVDFVAKYANSVHDVESIQRKLRIWWINYIDQIALNVSSVILTKIPPHMRKSI